MNDAVREVRVQRHPAGSSEDAVVVEEPLEIRIGAEPLAVLMRTPGDDRALAAGFLLTEGVIDGLDDLRALEPCSDPNKPNAANTIVALLSEGCSLDRSRLERARRQFFASSSCGLCGKATIENLHVDVPPQPRFLTVPRGLVLSSGERARAGQAVFGRTGGLHGVALFDLGGARLGAAEDVGRHNAMDKVVGRRLLDDALPLDDHVLWISGRAGFEVVQKALVARAGALISVGAPSSLAVELAERSRMTLIGFATAGRFNVYAGRCG